MKQQFTFNVSNITNKYENVPESEEKSTTVLQRAIITVQLHVKF